MREVKRYSQTTMRSFIETQHLQDDEEGNLVGYDDYAELKAEFEEMKKYARKLAEWAEEKGGEPGRLHFVINRILELTEGQK